jgi:ubiquinone/menaquinone biosynthesis C-methylase UbiE
VNLFDHFNFLGPYYEKLISPQSPEKLLAVLDLPQNGVVLDAGGGTGRVARYLREKSARVVVADPCFGMLRETLKKTGLEPVRTPAERMPFGDQAFARIVMVDALHHVANQQQTASELWRILACGGRIVIEEPDINTFKVKLIALAEKLLLMRSHFLEPQKIAALFAFPDVQVHIEREGMNAWVIVEKKLDQI